MSYPPTPPLLLTRRLSSFLHASLTALQEQHHHQPALQTALLITPSGKLLAYESPIAVRTLRTQSSVAASLWAIHAAETQSVTVALGQPSSPSVSPTFTGQTVDSGPADTDSDGRRGCNDGSIPVSIAASFNGGAIFVVRRLRCGLLFACATPPPDISSRPVSASEPGPGPAAPPMTSPPAPDARAPITHQSSHTGKSAAAFAPQTQQSLVSHLRKKPTPGNMASDGTTPESRNAFADIEYVRPSTATDAASITTTGTTATATSSSSVAATVAIARRQVEELARLLDEKLCTLSVPEENIGVNGFR